MSNFIRITLGVIIFSILFSLASPPRILKTVEAHYLYIRDYNRFETEYILEYEDLKNGTMFWDNVSIGGYAMDLQATNSIPKGIGFGRTDRYGLPLRSFELKSYENVLVVGKNIGASIKAYGSARIMANNALAA